MWRERNLHSKQETANIKTGYVKSFVFMWECRIGGKKGLFRNSFPGSSYVLMARKGAKFRKRREEVGERLANGSTIKSEATESFSEV